LICSCVIPLKTNPKQTKRIKTRFFTTQKILIF
jgi:hypothetical protein